MTRFDNYGDFWLHYLREHSRPATRVWHYAGTALGLVLVVVLAVTGIWWLALAALAAGYLFAWIGHAVSEHNRPATFTHFLWSLISDLRMFAYFVTGRLRPELERAGVPLDGGPSEEPANKP